MSYTVSDRLRAVVDRYTAGNMNATVRVLRGSLGALDPVTNQMAGLNVATTLYSGPARVHPVAGLGPLEVGGGVVDERQATISIPMDAPVPNRDDLVIVDAEPQDADLVGSTWRVLQVDGGGMFGNRRGLFCQSWHPSRYWGQQ